MFLSYVFLILAMEGHRSVIATEFFLPVFFTGMCATAYVSCFTKRYCFNLERFFSSRTVPAQDRENGSHVPLDGVSAFSIEMSLSAAESPKL